MEGEAHDLSAPKLNDKIVHDQNDLFYVFFTTNDTFLNLEKLLKIANLLCHGQTKTYNDQTKIIIYCLSSSAKEKYQIMTGRVWVFFTYRPQAILS